MIVGKVEGTVWGSRQCVLLEGRRIVRVRPVGLEGLEPGDGFGDDPPASVLRDSMLLAVDPLGADVGQTVVVSIGSRVRDLVAGEGVPTKNCVVAIVDRADVESR